ncbi:class E sortase [Lentzea nigeriaca]|uniref:class E sortase n=1 Tax=Lentzea nigeriaca TaxID=1128665 RepID=UPI001EF8536D|nr:class E sortase [Lentzea nigeriaca]MBM7857584.1 sortase (surface protein transpeptidase) [Lentzea nigeriaca]
MGQPPRGMPPRPPRPRPVDPPTEVIPRVEDEDDYDDEYYDDDDYYDDEDDQPAPPPESFARKAVRGFGEALITMGMVVLLFVVYEVYVTDLLSAEKQEEATAALDSEWSSNVVTPPPSDPNRKAKTTLIEGKAFAKMYIPIFGNDWKFSVVEGTTDKHLEIGPGHYKDTAQPGEPGNFAIAGHRVGKGAPFNDLDLLQSCNAVVVQTQTQWFVYRVLPMSNEVAGWASNPKSKDAACAGVAPLATTLGDAYAKTVGQEIVVPTQGEVIASIPHQVNATVPPEKQARLLTLTTCHPRFSDRQRLIVHAIETKSYPVADGFVPPEMTEG